MTTNGQHNITLKFVKRIQKTGCCNTKPKQVPETKSKGAGVHLHEVAFHPEEAT